jgi:release factor glutamine methyltransferase
VKADAVLVRGPRCSNIDRASAQEHLITDRTGMPIFRSILDGSSWRSRVASSQSIVYSFDGGSEVHLHRGIPARPLPRSSLRRLYEELLTEGEPLFGRLKAANTITALVYAAVQALRPSWNRLAWQRYFSARVQEVPTLALVSAAHKTATAMAVHRALQISEIVVPTSRTWDLRGVAWRAGAVAARIPRRPTRWLAGTPAAGSDRAKVRFCQQTFEVDPGVFVPVSLTEGVVNATLKAVDNTPRPIVIDVGTGCGAVALAIAAKRPDAEIHAADISARAIRSARRNARNLRIETVRWYAGSLLDPFPRELEGRVDVVVVNVPYVPARMRRAAWREMPGSFEGTGSVGLGLHRNLLWNALALIRSGGALIVQMTGDQWAQFRPELASFGFGSFSITGQAAADVVSMAILHPPSSP